MWWSKSANKLTQNNSDAVLQNLQTNGVQLGVEELLAYQRKASLLNLAPTKSLHGHMAGNYLAKTKGRGMEFDEVRHYQPGDDIRAIDWRVTARTGKTHTKLYREEIERPILLVTDLSHSMLFGSQLLFKSVQAAHIAALIAWHAKSKGDKVGGIVFNDLQHKEIKPRSRQTGVLRYLHALTSIHEDSIQNWQQNKASNTDFFLQNCMRIRQVAKPGSLIYLISDVNHINEESVKQLLLAARHCELVVCHVVDSLEISLPDMPHKISVAVTDGQQNQQLVLGDTKTAAEYKNQAKLEQSHRMNLLNKSGIRVIDFSAGQALESQLASGVL